VFLNFGGRRSLVRVDSHQETEELLSFWIQVLVQTGASSGGLPVREMMVLFLCFLPGKFAGQQSHQRDGTRPDVGSWSPVGILRKYLRCHVCLGTANIHHELLADTMAEQGGLSEISQLKLAISVEKNVVRLYVPVGDAKLVQVLHGRDQLTEIFASIGKL